MIKVFNVEFVPFLISEVRNRGLLEIFQVDLHMFSDLKVTAKVPHLFC